MHNLKELFRRIVVSILTFEAVLVLKKYRPKIVVVTGSVGKTSAKDAVYSALSRSFFIRRSEKSFNSDIGVPLTVLGVKNGWSNIFQWIRNILDGLSLIVLNAPYPKWLVMEVGADRPGDISKSLSWLTPDTVVATRFPDISVHVEFYKNPEDVITEELSPLEKLTSGGLFVGNADDAHARSAITKEGVKRVLFGFGDDALLRASNFSATAEDEMPLGVAFDVSYEGESAHVELSGVAGRSHAYSVLAGLGVAVGVGIPLGEAAKNFTMHEIPSGRMNLIQGVNQSIIIDDTYNASPAATEEALATLATIPRRGRRIAVLADMLELGSFSVEEHFRMGVLAQQSADLLLTVGVRAKGFSEGAKSAGMPDGAIMEFDRGADAISALVSLVQSGDVVLVKGSQSLRMERVVKSLMKEPERAKDLLVRQDAEWLSRA